MEQSKTWITAETLDARIEEALDNPVSLTVVVSPPEEQMKSPEAKAA